MICGSQTLPLQETETNMDLRNPDREVAGWTQ